MSLVDPECHPELHGDDRRVCASCFDDADLQLLVRGNGDWSSCDFCGALRAKTVELSLVADHIVGRAQLFFGRAVDQLPYESAEGGWMARNFDSFELLQDEIGLDLPRDESGDLLDAIVEALGEDQWCDFDWTRLELDDSLTSSWRRFADKVKHHRRFFFHDGGEGDFGSEDDRSAMELFRELAKLVETLGRVRTYPAGLHLFRARERRGRERHTSPAALGPPPVEFALQSNRMNPPGIPMFYGAENARLAMDEVRNQRVSLARFETMRDIRVVDLVDLPPVPGLFSDASRRRRQHLSFLHKFAHEISLPVPRDDRVHVEYLPTQVFTEFLRDVRIGGEPIDGLRYPTATGGRGANIVLFADQRAVVDAIEDDEDQWFAPTPWLRLSGVVQKRGIGSV